MSYARRGTFAALTFALVAAAVPMSGRAGSIFLADGSFDSTDIASSNFFSDGQFWQNPVHTGNGTLNQITLDFGSGPTTGLSVTFDSASGRVAFGPGGTAGFIEPMHLINANPVLSGYDPSYQNGYWQYGQLATQLLTPGTVHGPFDINTALNAYRFTWPAQCPASVSAARVCTFADLMAFQAVIIEIDPEHFQLQFNYNNGFGKTLPAGDAITGLFQLGANPLNSTTYTGPFIDNGPNFCFANGVQAPCATVAVVPEPETATLLALGALALGFPLRRRRSSRSPGVS